MRLPRHNSARRSKHRGGELQVAALQRINQVISTTLDLDEVLRRIITELVHLLAAQSASVILHNHATNEAELTTSYGPTAAVRTLRYPLPGSSRDGLLNTNDRCGSRASPVRNGLRFGNWPSNSAPPPPISLSCWSPCGFRGVWWAV